MSVSDIQATNSTPNPPPLLNYINLFNKTNKSPLSKTFELNECTWAINYPDIQKAFFLARVCLIKPPKYCKYFKIYPIIQNGPTCGLTAVSMLFSGKPSPETLLENAKMKNMTKNGEMFSAKILLEIFKESIDCSEINIDKQNFQCFLFDGNMNCDTLRSLLKKDAVVLFPFDVDLNFSPCLKNGTKAHWGLIVGSAVSYSDEFYVIARHGKSKNLALWPLEDVAKSNSNLNEIDSSKDELFVLPDGGISGKNGLKQKCIVIVGLKNEIINVI